MQAAEPLTEMMSYEEYEEAFEAWDYMPGEDGCPLRTEGMRLGLVERPKSCARLFDPGLGGRLTYLRTRCRT